MTPIPRIPAFHLGKSATQFVRWTIDLIFPPRCAGCGTQGVDWCKQCHGSLKLLQEPLCRQCGSCLTQKGDDCAACRMAPLPLKVRSYAQYQGCLIGAILQLKYRPNRRLAAEMANWLQELYAKIDWRITLLVPVPLGRERMRQRGYNQAGLVASALADILNLRMEEDALRRIRETRSQVGLNEVARKQNVEDAFAANVSMVQHEHILLIDDLITSGATLSSCAETLWDAGAAGVYGFTIAKA